MMFPTELHAKEFHCPLDPDMVCADHVDDWFNHTVPVPVEK
jgi:hypothetical protein